VFCCEQANKRFCDPQHAVVISFIVQFILLSHPKARTTHVYMPMFHLAPFDCCLGACAVSLAHSCSPTHTQMSSRVTQPKSQGASQAMLYATGLTPEDMNKAQVGQHPRIAQHAPLDATSCEVAVQL
jgi:hypothetical protein